jgi:hypothetical protein
MGTMKAVCIEFISSNGLFALSSSNFCNVKLKICFLPESKFSFTKIDWLKLYQKVEKLLFSEGYECIRLTK